MSGRLTTWRGNAARGLVVLALLLVIAYVVIWIYRVLAGFPVLNAVQPPTVRVAIVLTGFAGFVLDTSSLMRTTIETIVEATLDMLINRNFGFRISITPRKWESRQLLTALTTYAHQYEFKGSPECM
ncbi:hypothetical protein [Haloferax sp. ATB1]|uniref:hypothetical protein n=1 Tax=Haloferax sp. ATB1 TaxID=1508454 RepID=UPI001F51F19A|nr:hypothetical protein [Haloferax sp. ATB1]